MNQPKMGPEDFQKRLAEMPEPQRSQMLGLLKVISQPPETMVNLFERIGLRWKREYIGTESEYPYGAVVINWTDFMKAETVLQDQGPILKRLMTSEFGQQSEDQFNVEPTGEVVKREPQMRVKPDNGDNGDEEEEVFN